MITAALVVADTHGGSDRRGGVAYDVSTTRTQQQLHSNSSSVMNDTSSFGSATICVTDATDARAKKEVSCDIVCTSREELIQSIVRPMVYGIVPRRTATGPGYDAAGGSDAVQLLATTGGVVEAAPLYAQGTVVVDGLRAARTATILDPYNGLLVAAIQAIARRDTTKAIFLSAVELDEHNQLIDLLAPDARSQRSASPNVALKAGVLRHQIPSVVEDTTDGFTAIEETTFEDVTRDCHPTLRYLADKCVSDTRHQVFSLVAIHRHGIANTTLQCISHVVNEVTRGTRATRHCINNAASLLESRSHAISFTSTKILFLLKPILMGKQPGAWVTVLDPTTPQGADGTTESFKEVFATMQTLSRISGIGQHGGLPCLIRQLSHHVDHQQHQGTVLSLAATPIQPTQSNDTTVKSIDTTIRRASRLTEQIDKRFAELTRVHGNSPRSGDALGAVEVVDSMHHLRGQQHQRRDRSSSMSSSDLVPRQRVPQHTPVSMSRDSHQQPTGSSSRPASSRRTPNKAQGGGTQGSSAATRRSESARQAREMQRRLELLDASEREVGRMPRRGGATLLTLEDSAEGGTEAVHKGQRRSAGAKKSDSRTAAGHTSVRSPYRVQHDDGPTRGDPEDAVALKQQQQQTAHAATLLHNYETYKHVMEGVLARLRRDLEAQSTALDAAQKQLRAKERTLRNGNDGLVVTTRDLEAANRKIRLLEEAEQAAATEHQRQKASWRSQRLELVKANDAMQHKMNDLLETINGLEGVLSKSREAASSRTRGLTLSTTTMTTVSGLVHLTHDAAMMRLAQEHGVPPTGGSPLRRGVTSASSSTHSITAPQRGGGVSTPPPVAVGIPRGTQTTFPTVMELQDAVSEKDDAIAEQSERISQLSHDLDVMRSREHSLHQRIHELEHDVSGLEEREISVKTILLKTEQALRVERQEADRQRRDREVNMISIACQATPPPDLQDILINDLEATNKRLSAQIRGLTHDASLQSTTLAAEQAAHVATASQLQDRTKELAEAIAASQAALDAAHLVHSDKVLALEARLYELEHMLEEARQARSTNSPQSERTNSNHGSGREERSRSSSAGAHQRGSSHAHAPAQESPLGEAVHVPTVYKRHLLGIGASAGRASSAPRQTGVSPASAPRGNAERTPPHAASRDASQATQSPSPPIAVRMRHGHQHPPPAGAVRQHTAPSSSPRDPSHGGAPSARPSHNVSVGSTLVASPIQGQDQNASLPRQARLPSNRDHAALVSPSPTSPTAVATPQRTQPVASPRATPQSMQSPNTMFTSYMSRGGGGTAQQPRSGANASVATRKPVGRGGGGGILGGMRR